MGYGIWKPYQVSERQACVCGVFLVCMDACRGQRHVLGAVQKEEEEGEKKWNLFLRRNLTSGGLLSRNSSSSGFVTVVLVLLLSSSRSSSGFVWVLRSLSSKGGHDNTSCRPAEVSNGISDSLMRWSW